MELAGIYDGDLLVIDRSLEPVNGDVVIAAVAGGFTCKRLNLKARTLEADSSIFYPIIPCTDETCIEGVVVHTIQQHIGMPVRVGIEATKTLAKVAKT